MEGELCASHVILLGTQRYSKKENSKAKQQSKSAQQALNLQKFTDSSDSVHARGQMPAISPCLDPVRKKGKGRELSEGCPGSQERAAAGALGLGF